MKRPTSFLFLAALFCNTFEKLHWSFVGNVSIDDIFALLFLGSFLMTSRTRVPKTTALVLGFFAVFLLSYLVGFFNIADHDSEVQFVKGLIKWLIHFSFLAAGVAWLARRGRTYYWRSWWWLSAGMVVNAVYGVLQLLDARAGGNLDALVLSPLTGGASQINIYGGVNGAQIFRPNAITGDPNHLGIMLIVPLLVLTPIYLRLERGHRLRRRLAITIGFLVLVELLTLSRSGLLGLAVGVVILGFPYRRYLLRKELLAPLGAVAVVLLAIAVTRWHYVEVLVKSRVQTGGGSTNTHLEIYSFVPQVLHMHPLFGLGLNTFSVYYELVTGKSNWGPHSYYVALMVETGLVGTALFGIFIVWVFRRLGAARARGRAMAAARDPLATRIRPLSWGCTAALAGTLAANAFYLTMQFYYFFAFLALALAIPVVFSRREAEAPEPERARALVPA
jgi:O-antigen ligase